MTIFAYEDEEGFAFYSRSDSLDSHDYKLLGEVTLDTVELDLLLEMFDMEMEQWNYHSYIGMASAIYTVLKEEIGEELAKRCLFRIITKSTLFPWED